jgi:ectoine hydroxylase-related dioxygenase (phytanoyl-CoA dioxygenase family)
MPLIQLPANTAAPELAACVRENGYVIVEGLASPEDLDRIDQELAPHYGAGRYGDSDISGKLAVRTGALIARSPTVRKLIMNDLVLDVVRESLPDIFQIGLTEMISLWPGAEAQFLHRDEGAHGDYPFRSDYETTVSTLWAASDYTEEMGATRLVLGSHKRESGLKFTHADTVAAEMPRGSVLIYSGKLYHGGGQNNSQQVRRALNVDFICAWLRQMENQYLACPPEIARTLPPDLLRLMGYQVTRRAAGRVGDWLDPLSVLMGGSDRVDEAAIRSPSYETHRRS